MKISSLITLLITIHSLQSIDAIKPLSLCSVELDDGRVIDLKSLDNAESPR